MLFQLSADAPKEALLEAVAMLEAGGAMPVAVHMVSEDLKGGRMGDWGVC